MFTEESLRLSLKMPLVVHFQRCVINWKQGPWTVL